MKEPLINHLDAFIHVARLNSMTKAASALKRTKAAVSHSISQLERSMKIPLFVRTTRSIRLTAEGEKLYRQSARLYEELMATKRLISGLHDKPSGHLRVMVSTYFANSDFIHLIREYQSRYPDVHLEVMVEERRAVRDDDVDILYGVSWPVTNDDIVRKKIAATRYIFCASPDYIKRCGKPRVLQDLSEHSYITHSSRQKKVVKLIKKQQLALSSTLSTNSAVMMKQLALSGLGIIQVHEYLVQQELAQKQLIEVLPNTTKETDIYIYYQKDRYVQPKVRAFIELYNELFL